MNKPYTPSKMRTPEDHDRFLAALVPVDEAFRQSEAKYGVGRLERLVSTATLTAYRRGWDRYRVAIEEGDPEGMAEIGPKMIAALAWMDGEATAAGHQPLAPDTWEAGLPDGSVLVVVRSNAEAIAVQRGARKPGTAFTGTAGHMDIKSTETALAPDLAVTVRAQHEGRHLRVVTLAEIGRLLMAQDIVKGVAWEGTPAPSGVQRDESLAYDLTRQGYPLDRSQAANLDF
jgi:hypothetical protein